MKLLRDKVKKDTYTVNKLCGMISREELRNDHPQQRKSGQWDSETRDNFIVTVIQNEDFDPIKICEQLKDYGVVLWLIDGLQRCTTIEGYKAGKFALGKNINPSSIEYQEVKKDDNGKIVKDEHGNTLYENVSFDLRGKSYSQLPAKLQEDFDSCAVDVVKHLDCTDEEVGRHIVRYNSSVKMTPSQKIITYMDKIAKDVKELSAHPFFADYADFSPTKEKGGAIDKVVNESIMGLNFFDNWTKTANVMGKFLNKNATKDMFVEFKNMLDRLYKVVNPTTGKLFNEKNTVVWCMLFKEFLTLGLPDEAFGQFLNNLNTLENIKVTLNHTRKPKGSEETNCLSFKQIDTCNSTKDKGMIEDKLYILKNIMFGYFGSIVKKDNTENLAENPKETTLSFVQENANPDATEEDIEFYRDMVEDCVKVDEPVYQQCERAVIAIMAYACMKEQDEEFEKWIQKYKNQTNFSPSQKTNFTYMKNSFDKYVQKMAV